MSASRSTRPTHSRTLRPARRSSIRFRAALRRRTRSRIWLPARSTSRTSLPPPRPRSSLRPAAASSRSTQARAARSPRRAPGAGARLSVRSRRSRIPTPVRMSMCIPDLIPSLPSPQCRNEEPIFPSRGPRRATTGRIPYRLPLSREKHLCRRRLGRTRRSSTSSLPPCSKPRSKPELMSRRHFPICLRGPWWHRLRRFRA